MRTLCATIMRGSRDTRPLPQGRRAVTPPRQSAPLSGLRGLLLDPASMSSDSSTTWRMTHPLRHWPVQLSGVPLWRDHPAPSAMSPTPAMKRMMMRQMCSVHLSCKFLCWVGYYIRVCLNVPKCIFLIPILQSRARVSFPNVPLHHFNLDCYTWDFYR